MTAAPADSGSKPVPAPPAASPAAETSPPSPPAPPPRAADRAPSPPTPASQHPDSGSSPYRIHSLGELPSVRGPAQPAPAAVPSELQRIKSLSDAVLGVPWGVSYSVSQLSRWMLKSRQAAQNRQMSFVATVPDSSRLIGAAVCFIAAPGVLELAILAVSSAWTRRGVGSALLRAVVAAADRAVTADGASDGDKRRQVQLRVHVRCGNDAALAFYEQQGFCLRETKLLHYPADRTVGARRQSPGRQLSRDCAVWVKFVDLGSPDPASSPLENEPAQQQG